MPCRSRRISSALSLFALLALAFLAAPSEGTSLSASRVLAHRSHRPPSASTAHFRFFSPSSFWNTSVSSAAPLDPSSSAVVKGLVGEVRSELLAGSGPSIGTSTYSVPVYTVSAAQPAVPVQLTSPFEVPALRAAFEAVPLPPGARPAPGSDGHLVVWQPSTDRLWEFWQLAKGPSGWRAAWGGAIREASANPGVYDSSAWPGATRWWGASASSLSIAGGLITLEDLRKGEINHALAMAVPEVRAGVYATPAMRTDGKSTDPLSLPEGAHLRLDPKLDIGSLHLPYVTRLIAEAAQRYGIFVRDGASVVKLYAQDPVTAPTNPYTGPDGYFEGSYPAKLLSSFPWSHLRLLSMELHPAE